MLLKTGIVATVGPASSDPKVLEQFIRLGVTTFRLNFSHGSFAEHKARLDAIRQASAAFPHAVAVLGDLCGPKLRIGKIEPAGQSLKAGDRVVIGADAAAGTANRFGTNYPDLAGDVSEGQRVLIDDGLLVLRVVEKKSAEVDCEVIVGGPISSGKGINLPDSKLRIAALTEKDFRCADWAIENGLDYLALSFVQHAGDIEALKAYLKKAGSPIQVVAKIEKPQAVADLEAIVDASDAIMVARGDLGVEMDLAEVPLVQKRITALCRKKGKSVIVATQVVQSMIENPSPTRAEASDIANAVMDYTDAIMLSGETAVGKYPIEAVRAIAHISRRSEQWLEEQNFPRPAIETEARLRSAAAVARAVAEMVDTIQVKLLLLWSDKGHAARLFSKARLDVPVAAFCPDPMLCRQMSLNYGILPVCLAKPKTTEAFLEAAGKMVVDAGWANRGDRVLVIPPPAIVNSQNEYCLLQKTL